MQLIVLYILQKSESLILVQSILFPDFLTLVLNIYELQSCWSEFHLGRGNILGRASLRKIGSTDSRLSLVCFGLSLILTVFLPFRICIPVGGSNCILSTSDSPNCLYVYYLRYLLLFLIHFVLFYCQSFEILFILLQNICISKLKILLFLKYCL